MGKPVPLSVVRSDKTDSVKRSPKLESAVQYLRDNPEQLKSSLRQLENNVTIPVIGKIKRTTWGQAKRIIKDTI